MPPIVVVHHRTLNCRTALNQIWCGDLKYLGTRRGDVIFWKWGPHRTPRKCQNYTSNKHRPRSFKHLDISIDSMSRFYNFLFTFRLKKLLKSWGELNLSRNDKDYSIKLQVLKLFLEQRVDYDRWRVEYDEFKVKTTQCYEYSQKNFQN